VYAIDGRRYLDCLSAYSALNQGHCHPRIVQALLDQAARVTLTSARVPQRPVAAFLRSPRPLVRHADGAAHEHRRRSRRERHQTVRRWATPASASRRDQAEIIVCENNFHGRTTTITGFSSEPLYRDGFGPFTPGFVSVPFGDIDALEAPLRPPTPAPSFVEPHPVRGRHPHPGPTAICGGPPICVRVNACCWWPTRFQTGSRPHRQDVSPASTEDVQPDVYILGKALSGGVIRCRPLVSSTEILGVFRPGSHGSTLWRQSAGLRGGAHGAAASLRKSAWPTLRRAGRVAASMNCASCAIPTSRHSRTRAADWHRACWCRRVPTANG